MGFASNHLDLPEIDDSYSDGRPVLMKRSVVPWVAISLLMILPPEAVFSQHHGVHKGTSTTRVSSWANPSVIYEGRSGEGLWKSTDGGESFLQINNGLSNPYPITIVISPNDDQQIFVGCAQHDSSPTLYKSNDGGQHWSIVPPFHTILMTITMISFQEGFPKKVQVTAFDARGISQVWRSDDGGLLWVREIAGSKIGR
jgi:hypothetical protein